MDDAEVLAWLWEDERGWYDPTRKRNSPHGNCDVRQNEWLRRLALARRETAAAVAAEREACAAMCNQMASNVNPPYTPYAALDMAAARIRSRA